MTKEEALNNLDDLLQYGGLVMSEKYIESIRIATIELEKTLKQEPCEDAISRQQAIDKMQELEDEDIEAYGCSIPEGFDGERAIEALKTLPSVQTQPKTGHWKVVSDGYGDNAYICECSECNEEEIKEMAIRDSKVAIFLGYNPDRIKAIEDAMNKAITDKAESEGKE